MSETRFLKIGRRLPPADLFSEAPDWQQAQPAWIEGALRHALSLPSGGWYVVDAARAIERRARRYRIAGEDYVVWRTDRGPVVAPDSCPHMGARLSDGVVREGRVVCPWHGLALGQEPHGTWRPLPVHDDGVLLWVQASGSEERTATPLLPVRPER
jgi:isorenieratene synthase